MSTLELAADTDRDTSLDASIQSVLFPVPPAPETTQRFPLLSDLPPHLRMANPPSEALRLFQGAMQNIDGSSQSFVDNIPGFQNSLEEADRAYRGLLDNYGTYERENPLVVERFNTLSTAVNQSFSDLRSSIHAIARTDYPEADRLGRITMLLGGIHGFIENRDSLIANGRLPLAAEDVRRMAEGLEQLGLNQTAQMVRRLNSTGQDILNVAMSELRAHPGHNLALFAANLNAFANAENAFSTSTEIGPLLRMRQDVANAARLRFDISHVFTRLLEMAGSDRRLPPDVMNNALARRLDLLTQNRRRHTDFDEFFRLDLELHRFDPRRLQVPI